jgi:DNA-binding NarL/FixJ family response regulator
MKRSSDRDIIWAAQEVLAGRIYLSEYMRHQLEANQHQNGIAVASPIDLLADRELEVFLLMGQGFAPRHIAEKLSLSPSTVEVYRERLKEKLGLESSPVLLRYAVRWCKDHDVS